MPRNRCSPPARAVDINVGQNMFRRVLIVIGVSAIAGCSSHTMPSDPSTLANLVELPVKGVNVSDGIDESEAHTLASAYYYELKGVGCGGISLRGQNHDSWFFSTANGYAGTPGPDIIVRKDGSVVYQAGGPDLYLRHGVWVCDKRKDPKAVFDKLLDEETMKRANQTPASGAVH